MQTYTNTNAVSPEAYHCLHLKLFFWLVFSLWGSLWVNSNHRHELGRMVVCIRYGTVLLCILQSFSSVETHHDTTFSIQQQQQQDEGLWNVRVWLTEVILQYTYSTVFLQPAVCFASWTDLTQVLCTRLAGEQQRHSHKVLLGMC
jgi:hypothetical protein